MSNRNIGTVSNGTMRPEDLIPDFIWELRNQKPCRHRGLCTEIERRTHKDGYYDSEDAGYDLETLFDALGEYAPAYFYFGANSGDGADYGYWLSESFQDDFDGLRVSDTSEIPSGYFGEVLLVTDHGNMSLYSKSRNHKLRELWAIV